MRKFLLWHLIFADAFPYVLTLWSDVAIELLIMHHLYCLPMILFYTMWYYYLIIGFEFPGITL